MAMSVVYTVWDGQIVSENRGGVERDYIPDPLGNTIALVDMNHTITDTWTYWPYGEEQNHGGSSTTSFTFLGTLGYFVDFLNQLYVRMRHPRVDLTRWITADSIWPFQRAYTYAGAAPLLRVDPSGEWHWQTIHCDDDQKAYLRMVFSTLLTSGALGNFLDCLDSASCRLNLPNGNGSDARACIEGFLGANIKDPASFVINCSRLGGCDKDSGCAWTEIVDKPPTINLCPPFWKVGGCPGQCVLLHEIIHACGSGHVSGGNQNFECVAAVPGCGGSTGLTARGGRARQVTFN